MKNYKEFEKKYIGSSDIASVIIRSPMRCDQIHFGSDGGYDAYICEGKDVEIGSHYVKELELHAWAWIYDDNGLTMRLEGEHIDVYRAGDFGVIIHVYD